MDATLTVVEFTKLLVARILQWNKLGKPELILRPELMADRVDPGPAAIYQWGLAHLNGSPRYLGLDAAVPQLLEGVDAGVTAKGITNANLRWYEAWMNDPVLWHRRLTEQRFQLYENPWVAESAWAFSAVDNLLRTVTLNSDRPVDSSWAPEDLRDSVEMQIQYRARHEIQNQHFGTAVEITCQDVIDGAKVATRDAHAPRKQSKRSRVANIAENRRAEQTAPAPAAPHRIWNPSVVDEPTTIAPGYDDWIEPL